MKKIFITFCLMLLFSPRPLFSQGDQSIEALMTRRVLSCFEIALNSFKLIPSFYQNNETDSALLVLNYWNQQCEWEIASRSRVIFALKNGTFSADSLDPYFVYSLAKKKKNESEHIPLSAIEGEYITGYRSYETFLASVAREALSTTKPSTVEHLLARHFSGMSDSTLIKLQSTEYVDTKLSRDYQNVVESIKSDYSEFYLGVEIGSWLPASKRLTVFGPRPELSLTFFSSHLGYNTQLYFAFRFGPSRDAYNFKYKGIPYSTSRFTGLSMGFEALPRIVISKNSDFSLLGGLMIDSYSPPKVAGNSDDKGANSICATIGLKYGYKLSPWGTPVIVLETRLNPFLISASGFDDAPLGTSATLRLSVFFGKDGRAEMLDRLSYQE